MSGNRSAKTGFAAGDRVAWDTSESGIAAGTGVVTVPNDGGFVWVTSDDGTAPIILAEHVRRIDA